MLDQGPGPKGRLILWAVLLSFGLLLPGCAGRGAGKAEPAKPGAADVQQDDAKPGDIASVSVETLSGATPVEMREATIYRGTGNYVRAPKKTASVTSNGDVTLNFVDADIRDVAKAVLGDALKLTYSVDPSVQGKVTLQTATPIERSDVLSTLEVALRLNGVALLEQKGVYVLAPLSESQKRASVPRLSDGNNHGYGLEIVQLKYVTVADMQRVLGAVAPQGGVVYADPARNLIILSGTEQEIDTLVATISLFDVNYLKSTSFGVFTPQNVTADELATDLENVVGGTESPVAGMLKFIPIPRVNSLLVIAKQPQLLDDVAVWIKRLDVQGDGPTHRRTYLYRVQNAKASDLAETLGRLYGATTATTASVSSRSDEPTGSLSMGSTFGGAASSRIPAGFGTSTLPVTSQRKGRDRSSASSASGDGSTGLSGSGLRIVADERNNLLMILATPHEYEDISAALKEIDIAPDQVLIEATIAEVSLTDELKFGVQWLFNSDKSSFTFTDDAAGAIVSKFPGFSYSYLIPDTQIVLNALSSLTNVKVISSPKLMVLDNQTATLQVGDEVPIATQSAVSVLNPDSPIVNTIQFRQTGVILEVTPRVNKSGLVTMDVSQEVSDVAATTTSTLNSPTIQQRKFTSSVAVQSGSTVALGGLIRDNNSKGKDGIPFLKDIPGLGAAFRSTNNTRRRTELLVFITPRIIHNSNDAEEVTEYLRAKLRDASFVADAKKQR